MAASRSFGPLPTSFVLTAFDLLSHVVLLIKKISSSQPPPAVGHLGVAKVHQVPPCSI